MSKPMNNFNSWLAGNAILGCLLLVTGTPAAWATTFGSDPCPNGGFNNIPDASYDLGLNVIPGSLSCSLTIATAGNVGLGNLVTVSLIGLFHEEASDLIVTLTHFADSSQSVIFGSTQTVFSRIGKMSGDPNDFGYFLPQFGFFGSVDTYRFNSGLLSDPGNNLWATAAGLGSGDFIPGESAGSTGYWTTSAFSGAHNNFSAAFAGQTLAGYWLLNVTDNAPGPNYFGLPNGTPGSLQQFELKFDTGTTIPEPGTGLMLAIAAIAGFEVRARRREV